MATWGSKKTCFKYIEQNNDICETLGYCQGSRHGSGNSSKTGVTTGVVSDSSTISVEAKGGSTIKRVGYEGKRGSVER